MIIFPNYGAVHGDLSGRSPAGTSRPGVAYDIEINHAATRVYERITLIIGIFNLCIHRERVKSVVSNDSCICKRVNN